MKKRTSPLPEIIFTSSNMAEAKMISRLAKSGDIKKIAPKIYSGNNNKSAEELIRSNWRKIIAHLYPGAVVSHRTALSGGNIVDDTVFITSTFTKKIQLPGLTVSVLKGGAATEFDLSLPEDGLYLSSEARFFMENLQPSRSQKTISKSVDIKDIEERIEKILRIRGESGINDIRDQARIIQSDLGLESEFKKLDSMVGALLTTRNDYKLQSDVGMGRASGEPYDPHRLELFESLFNGLRNTSVKCESGPLLEKEWSASAFYDAYFSNYIEGTDFEVDEAKSIVFDGKIIKGRTSDSHNVLDTYRLLCDHNEMLSCPGTASEYVSSLKRRHHICMGFSSDINPGEFKELSNRAGNTVFVVPDLVNGTLKKSFNYYSKLSDGFHKAIFVKFVIAEVHPFMDGNGRVSRAVMNSEMISNGQSRIIIPTVYRDDYLLSLKRLSKEGDAVPYIKMMARAARFTSNIDFSSVDSAEIQLEKSNAFLKPDEGVLIMPESKIDW